MTNEEAIKKQVNFLRTNYNIGIYPDEIEKLCNECDQENHKFACINELGYEQINLVRLGIEEPFHRASLVGFNSDNGPEWFIVDPTYGQFFENEIFKEYMLSKHVDFSLELLKQGYVRCSLSNIFNYFDGFIYSNAFTTNVDVDTIYQNIDKLLLSNNIINKELSETQIKLIELLKLKAELMKTNSKKKKASK